MPTRPRPAGRTLTVLQRSPGRPILGALSSCYRDRWEPELLARLLAVQQPTQVGLQPKLRFNSRCSRGFVEGSVAGACGSAARASVSGRRPGWVGSVCSGGQRWWPMTVAACQKTPCMHTHTHTHLALLVCCGRMGALRQAEGPILARFSHTRVAESACLCCARCWAAASSLRHGRQTGWPRTKCAAPHWCGPIYTNLFTAWRTQAGSALVHRVERACAAHTPFSSCLGAARSVAASTHAVSP